MVFFFLFFLHLSLRQNAENPLWAISFDWSVLQTWGQHLWATFQCSFPGCMKVAIMWFRNWTLRKYLNNEIIGKYLLNTYQLPTIKIYDTDTVLQESHRMEKNWMRQLGKRTEDEVAALLLGGLQGRVERKLQIMEVALLNQLTSRKAEPRWSYSWRRQMRTGAVASFT